MCVCVSISNFYLPSLVPGYEWHQGVRPADTVWVPKWIPSRFHVLRSNMPTLASAALVPSPDNKGSKILRHS